MRWLRARYRVRGHLGTGYVVEKWRPWWPFWTTEVHVEDMDTVLDYIPRGYRLILSLG